MNYKMNKFEIKETIYNSGVNNFSISDLQNSLKLKRNDFFAKYIQDKDNKIERSENIIEMYYKGTEFVGNFKDTKKNTIIGDNGENIGRLEVSRVPLYDKKTDKQIGIAHSKCIINDLGLNNTKYVECKFIYFLDNKFIPNKIRRVNGNSLNLGNYSTISFDFNYTSRPGLGSLFEEGDYFSSRGYYSLDNGSSRTTAFNNIYLPLNSNDKRRSVIVYFNKIDSNNFLPQENYGVSLI